MVDDKDVGFALGATEYMVKPVNNDLLLGMVKKCVRKSEAYVLIVEDDLATQSLVEANMLKQGFRVAVASNGHEALQEVRQAIPDLIITDLMMPAMDGFELIKRLRSHEQYKDIPVIVLSAMDLSLDERQNLSQLVQQIISKNSISMEEMVARVRNSLRDNSE
jgi:DNA-binding response OmpR family regulator